MTLYCGVGCFWAASHLWRDIVQKDQFQGQTGAHIVAALLTDILLWPIGVAVAVLGGRGWHAPAR